MLGESKKLALSTVLIAVSIVGSLYPIKLVGTNPLGAPLTWNPLYIISSTLAAVLLPLKYFFLVASIPGCIYALSVNDPTRMLTLPLVEAVSGFGAWLGLRVTGRFMGISLAIPFSALGLFVFPGLRFWLFGFFNFHFMLIFTLVYTILRAIGILMAMMILKTCERFLGCLGI